MATPVVMPQMGESIAEGTIVRWIKKVGEAVDRDEPLFEISTDKVDAEIPSPAAGVLMEIKVSEGETVAVNEVVATIGDGRDTQAPLTDTPASAPREGAVQAAASTQRQPDGDDPGAGRTAAAVPTTDGPVQPDRTNGSGERAPGELASRDELRRQKSSPLVRRIAREHNVDISD